MFVPHGGSNGVFLGPFLHYAFGHDPGCFASDLDFLALQEIL